MKKLLSSALALLLLLPSIPLHAQDTAAPAALPEGVTLPVSAAMPEGLTSCFDTYRFGSAQAVLTPSLRQASQSSLLSFDGTLTNENPYPLPDVTVWGKIFRVDTEAKDVNGPDVLAWIPIAEGVELAANETIPLSFEWMIPADAQPGTYQLATYVTNMNRFELSGLTFTDDIVGSKAEFEVVGDSVGAVRFAKDSVTVNGLPFRFAAFPPSLPSGTAGVPVTAQVMNTGTKAFAGTVTWKLYYWDRITDRTRLAEISEEIVIPAGGTTSVSYTVDDQEHTVYYLIGELESTLGSESIIGVRFVRSDVAEPRLNFVTGTPPSEGDNGTAVACIHATSQRPVENGRVALTAHRAGFLWSLLAPFGIGRIAEATYEGTIPPQIYALEAPLSSAVSSYVVSARLYQDDRLVDEVSVPYCASGDCSTPLWLYGLLVAVALIAVAGTALLIMRRRAATTQQTVTSTV